MNVQILESLVHAQLPDAARGDREAYGRIVAGCQGTVTSIALAIVRDVPASEDIAQEAFLSAWQNLRKLKSPGSFLPWLRQITRNLARDHLRAQARRGAPPADVEALLAAVADPQPGPDALVGDAQEHAVAAAVIDALPEETREILLLYYREGQSSRQVASLLGLQDAAVRKRLSRARQDVRAELIERLGDFARATAPGAGFTAAVAALLLTASPPAAAASAFGLGALGAAKGVVKLGLGAFGAAAAGIIGGLAGLWMGIRGPLRDPLDAREKRDLLVYGAFTSLWVIGFSVGITLLAKLPGWIPHLAFSLAFMAGIGFACQAWLPRILARRRARDRARDPLGSAATEARERSRARWGLWLGYGMGTAGLVAGLYLSGRMG